jgi:ComF family protein
MRLPETEAEAWFAIGPRSKPVLARVFDRALDLVFPPRCVSCDAFGDFICPRCQADMVPADGSRCLTCWMPLNPPHSCRRCRTHRLALSGVRSAFVYDAAARDAVLAFKFRGLSAIAPAMARSMAACFADWNPPVNALVPVPLAGHRRRLRGYNQSELLAKELSRLTGIPLARRGLARRRSTPPQARLTGEDRRRNVAGAFATGRSIRDGAVLLIDDVITTGATLDACARVLLIEGVDSVFALTFARED